MEGQIKKFKAKVIHKCETEADWELSSYIPDEGEIVTYKIDENFSYERVKLGDGINKVKDLPFVNDSQQKSIDYLLGKPTEGLVYQLSEDGTYAICTGLGTVTGPDIIIANEYQGVPVTHIGREAFLNCEAIKTVTLPDSLTSIGYSSFAYSGIEKIDIPDTVVEVGAAAFSDCLSLTTACLGKGITKASDGMFAHCTSLKELLLNSGLDTGDSSFYDTALEDVRFLEGTSWIDYCSF